MFYTLLCYVIYISLANQWNVRRDRKNCDKNGKVNENLYVMYEFSVKSSRMQQILCDAISIFENL